MNKLMLASLTVLLAGATALPAVAEDGGRRAAGEPSSQGVGNKGPAREEREEAREQHPGDRREQRDDRQDDRADSRDNRQADRAESRDNRQADRSGARDGRQAAREELRRDNRQDVRQTPVNPGTANAQSLARQRWLAQQQDRGDRNRDNDRDYSRDRDYGRDYDRDGSRNRDYGRDHDNDRDYARHNRDEWRNDRHDWRSDQRRDGNYYTRYRDTRWSGYNWYPQYRYRAPARYYYPSGYGPYRWQVGYRMPYGFYRSQAYLLDWRMYRLPPPPYGYHWLRVDRDVVLVSMVSGYVRDVLYGVFY